MHRTDRIHSRGSTPVSYKTTCTYDVSYKEEDLASNTGLSNGYGYSGNSNRPLTSTVSNGVAPEVYQKRYESPAQKVYSDEPTNGYHYQRFKHIYNKRKGQVSQHHSQYFNPRSRDNYSGYPERIPKYHSLTDLQTSEPSRFNEFQNNDASSNSGVTIQRWSSNRSIPEYSGNFNRENETDAIVITAAGQQKLCPVHKRIVSRHKSMDSLHFQGGNFDLEFRESSTQPQNFTQMNGLSRRYSGNSYQDLRSYEQDQSFDRQKRLSFEQDFVHSPASNGFDQQQVVNHQERKYSYDPNYRVGRESNLAQMSGTHSKSTSELNHMATNPNYSPEGMRGFESRKVSANSNFDNSVIRNDIRKLGYHSQEIERKPFETGSKEVDASGMPRRPLRESFESGYSTQESVSNQGKFTAPETERKVSISFDPKLSRSGCCVIIGGACNKGLIIAKKQLKKDQTVIIIDVSAQKGQKIVSDLEYKSSSTYSRVGFRECDATNLEKLRGCFDEIKKRFGFVTTLFNLVRDASAKNTFEYQLAVNLGSKIQSVLMLSEFGNNTSAAVLLASSAGIYPGDSMVLNTSSSGLIGFTRSFLKNDNLFRVNTACSEDDDATDDLVASAMLKLADDTKKSGVVLLVSKSKGLKYIEPVSQ